MEIKSKFITIPNVIVNDNELSINAKYLYGWIYNEVFYGDFTHSMNDIIELLNCSESTARKNLKELQKKHYIMIEIINGNQRKITPLVNDSMILKELDRKRLEEVRRKKFGTYCNREENEEQKEKNKKILKDFIERIV